MLKLEFCKSDEMGVNRIVFRPEMHEKKSANTFKSVGKELESVIISRGGGKC